jgi:hypothetical protein
VGPGAVTVKTVGTLGIGFCQSDSAEVPLQCAGNTGNINHFGTAAFGDPAWMGSRGLAITVTYDQQTCTDATSPPCGFTVDICDDRDQDSRCTDVGDRDDWISSTAASQGPLGSCKDEKKDCDDPNVAGWEGCLDDSIFGNWSREQIIVFVGVEAGPTTAPDVQAAVSTGTYTVWLEDKGSWICHRDPVPRTGCVWERSPVDGVLGMVPEELEGPDADADRLLSSPFDETPRFRGSCMDNAGNPAYFECQDEEFLIVLHVGLGQTSATDNSCSGQDPETSTTTSPVNIQSVFGPGVFKCEFTWFVAGAGACFVV